MTGRAIWKSEDLEKCTNGTATASFVGEGLCMDSRALEKGNIFIALQGQKIDGHKFIEDAYQRGASAVIVSEDFTTDINIPLLKVKDTYEALRNIGIASRARCRGKIIAVTGSAGKTGTKELLMIALDACGKSFASTKSFNSFTGVPFSLANMPEDTEFGIFEIGMNHAGEIEKLVELVRPHLAIITTIEPVHIEFFGTEEAIADAKAEIFTAMEGEGIAFLNLDNPHFQRLKDKAINCGVKKIYSFGEDEVADCILKDCKLSSGSVNATANVMGDVKKYRINIPGKHIAKNSLSVLAVVKALGLDLDIAIKALKKAEPVNGRGNRIKIIIEEGKPAITIVDESYNANPASMRAAFSVFELIEPEAEGRRIAVLGDMLELGRDGPIMHIDLANPLLKAKTDLLFCSGPLMEALYNVIPEGWRGGWAKNSQELAEILVNNVKAGDVILVKGSLGSKMSYIIQALQELNIVKG